MTAFHEQGDALTPRDAPLQKAGPALRGREKTAKNRNSELGAAAVAGGLLAAKKASAQPPKPQHDKLCAGAAEGPASKKGRASRERRPELPARPKKDHNDIKDHHAEAICTTLSREEES